MFLNRREIDLPREWDSVGALLSRRASRSARTVLHCAGRMCVLAVFCSILLAGCTSLAKRDNVGSRSYGSTSRQKDESSGLFSMFHKEPEPPKSVQDWMRLKRLDL